MKKIILNVRFFKISDLKKKLYGLKFTFGLGEHFSVFENMVSTYAKKSNIEYFVHQ